jgi:hypothetical protein
MVAKVAKVSGRFGFSFEGARAEGRRAIKPPADENGDDTDCAAAGAARACDRGRSMSPFRREERVDAPAKKAVLHESIGVENSAQLNANE